MDDPAIRALLSFATIPNPRTPKTKEAQVSFEKIIGGDLSEDVKEMLELGTQQRRLLVQALTYAGATPNPTNLIGAVNAYIPAVWHIQKSLEFSKDTKIKITSPLQFTWSSVLLASEFNEIERTQSQGVFVYELTFILVVRALAHYNEAKIQIDKIYEQTSNGTTANLENPTVINGLKESIKQLRIGAGVLRYTANSVICHWKKPPREPLPETRPNCLFAMADFFLCMAQRVFIARVLLEKKYKLLPALLLGLSNKYNSAHALMVKETSSLVGNPVPALDGEYIEETLFMQEFAIALAFRYASKQLVDEIENNIIGIDTLEGSFGKAVGFSILAHRHLDNKKLLKLLKSRLKTRFADSGYQVLQQLATESQALQQENSSVYYASVNTDDCELPPRSQHKFIVQDEGFEMPTVAALSFEQIIVAPPGIAQREFDQMPHNIKLELLQQHKEAMEQKAKEEKAAKKGFGLFGGKKKKKNPEEEQLYECPPGVNEKVFAKLPRKKQAKIVEQFQRNTSQPVAPVVSPVATTTPVAVSTDAVLQCPPGADPEVFNALPRHIQLEIIGQAAAPATATTPAPSSAPNNQPLW